MNKSLDEYRKELEAAGFTVDQDRVYLIDQFFAVTDQFKAVPSLSLSALWEDHVSVDDVKKMFTEDRHQDIESIADIAEAVMEIQSGKLPIDLIRPIVRRRELKYKCSMPYFDFQIAFVIMITGENGSMNADVGVSLDEFLKMAGVNSIDDLQCIHQEWVMASMKDVLAITGIPFEATDMYVITNKEQVNGAAVLLDKDYLKEVHEQLGDYYILPSSVHEILVIPMNALVSPSFNIIQQHLNSMIAEVNNQEVRYKEILSWQAYKYTDNGLEVV